MAMELCKTERRKKVVMRNINPTKVFISAEQAELSAVENAYRTTDLAAALENRGYSFRYVEGWFNGTPETTFCVFCTPGAILETIDELVALGARFGQASVLVVHGDNAAELVECFTSCSAVVGRFQEVDAASVEEGEDFTFADDKYYVVR